jgi:hypothetical protein
LALSTHFFLPPGIGAFIDVKPALLWAVRA